MTDLSKFIVKKSARCGPFLSEKLRGTQIEILAAAICYADFRTDEALRHTPLGYWRMVAEDRKPQYRRQAQAILALLHHWPHSLPDREESR